jgi:hypothetical protein
MLLVCWSSRLYVSSEALKVGLVFLSFQNEGDSQAVRGHCKGGSSMAGNW